MSFFRTYMRVYSTKATMVGCQIDTRAVLAHLMVGQPSCPVPGLFEAGPCAVAEQMEISVEVVREAFVQLCTRGLLECEEGAFVMRLPGVFGLLPPDDVAARAAGWVVAIRSGFPRHGVAQRHLDELSFVVGSLGQRSRVYFIQVGLGGPIKIGRSTAPLTRLATLQTGHSEQLRLLVTTTGGDELEKSLHQKLRSHRLRGEWFSPHAEVLAEVDDFKRMRK